ncbi:MAG: NnrS family protein [Alphaproteobacteria bacterium]|nr:NnrS family protein [Alphaproteobacteria bacterium]
MSQFVSIGSPAAPAGRRVVLFAHGFRPFFLAAGAYAVIAMLPWFAFLFSEGGVLRSVLDVATDPRIWHGHEMVFGFVAAAIAGFLLTAIPNWTGCPPVSGVRLAGLFAIWLLGRIGFWTMDAIPWLHWVGAAFFPALVALKAPVLIRAGKYRNMAFIPLLLLLFACDMISLRGLETGDSAFAAQGLLAAACIITLMVAIIGGRVIPGFTRNALIHRNIPQNIRSFLWLDRLCIGGGVLFAITTVFPFWEPLSAAVALSAGVAHFIRLSFWQGWKSLRDPLVWVLHAGYIWLPVGMTLSGLSHLGLVDHFIALHALTSGMMGIMILAIMSRASLGHTGRKLEASPVMAGGYLCVLTAVVLRTLIPLTGIVDTATCLKWSALLWMAGFSLFVVVYAPILLRPRADGRPG